MCLLFPLEPRGATAGWNAAIAPALVLVLVLVLVDDQIDQRLLLHLIDKCSKLVSSDILGVWTMREMVIETSQISPSSVEEMCLLCSLFKFTSHSSSEAMIMGLYKFLSLYEGAWISVTSYATFWFHKPLRTQHQKDTKHQLPVDPAAGDSLLDMQV